MLRITSAFLFSGIAILTTVNKTNAEFFDFQILPGQANPSSLEITIEVDGDSDSDSSTISGTARLELDSPVTPFGQARIHDLTLVMDEGLSFRLGPLNLLQANSEPGDLVATLLSPGPKVPVVNGMFTQDDNLVGLEGEVVVSVLDEPIDLSTLDPVIADMNDVEISVDGSQLSLGVELDLLFETILEDVDFIGTVPIAISVTGAIHGVANTSISGDFDGNGIVEVDDINLLTNAVNAGDTSSLFDVNGDGQVNGDDRTFWVENVAKTYFGDANLDGEFNSGDLVTAFSMAEYEDGIAENSSWEEGDWSGDFEFDSTDFVVAFSHGGFETGPRPSVAVPEPCLVFPSFLLMLVWAVRRRLIGAK